MTAGARARCFLCGRTAREIALKKVGQLHACSDEDGCNKLRADRVRARGDGKAPEASK